jgi:hypothetical protein
MKSHFQLGTAALEFDLHQRQAIDQDGHVIAVVALGRHADLIGYLNTFLHQSLQLRKLR